VKADMSIVHLISNASVLVQLVMLLLMIVSIASWTIIFQRYSVLSKAQKFIRTFEEEFWSGVDLGRLYVRLNSHSTVESGQENIFKAGFKEFARLRQHSQADAEAIMDGTQRSMRVALSREQERLEKSLSFLATVGSTSPYIGLFGTVWGIMNSFRSLAEMNQATLSVVAPGIAEALIATAMGLFAAIPAVIAYNRFSSQIESILNSYYTFSDEFSSILHRKAHGQVDLANSHSSSAQDM
jgi:biopolymer transport protein TolQ